MPKATFNNYLRFRDYHYFNKNTYWMSAIESVTQTWHLVISRSVYRQMSALHRQPVLLLLLLPRKSRQAVNTGMSHVNNWSYRRAAKPLKQEEVLRSHETKHDSICGPLLCCQVQQFHNSVQVCLSQAITWRLPADGLIFCGHEQ